MRTSARSTSFRGSLLIALLIASTMLTVGRGQEANEGATAERPRRAAVDMRDLIERFTADRSSVAYRYRVPMSQVAAERRERFREQWLKRLERIDFDRLSRDGQIDWLLLKIGRAHV